MAERFVDIEDTRVKVVKADITTLALEAITNPVPPDLKMEEGFSGYVREKGGEAIQEEALVLAPLFPGQVIKTKAGRLPAKYIIHAVTVDEQFNTSEELLRLATRNVLREASQLGVRSLGLPAFGCGKGGFSPEASAKIMAQEVLRHIKEEKSSLREIVFVLNEDAFYEAFQKNVLSYLEYICYKMQKGPFITVDAIIETEEGMVLIERKNPPFGWALPGGFVDYGESLEDAVVREVYEETGLKIEEVRQFHTYSRPGRDPRFHTIATVFSARAKGRPKAADDAANAAVVKEEELKNLKFAFDHGQIINEYLASRNKDVASLEERVRELEKSQMLKDDLTHMLVHDMRNLLMGVSCHIELLMMDEKLMENTELAEALQLAYRGTSELGLILKNLLGIVQMEQGRLELHYSQVDIRKVIQARAEMFKDKAALSHIVITVDIGKRDIQVNCDAELIIRVIDNLLVNAIKFTPSGGRIGIKARLDETKKEFLFTIENDGTPIPLAYQETIFEKFVQVKTEDNAGAVRKGIGLGLAFCKMAVEAHGGRIWVESREGEPIRFMFVLPQQRQ